MRVILTGLGSAGDVLPAVGVGRRLVQRGHDVVLIASDHFRPLAERSDLQFVGLGSDADYRRIIQDPAVFDRRRGLETVLRQTLQWLEPLYTVVQRCIVPGHTVVGAHVLDFASRMLQEQGEVPVATLLLSPALLIAMRLDEPEQVDMVLGDGARDRGATSDLISSDPATGAGVAFVRLEADPDPVRVRAAWVSDDDIRAMADQCIARLAPEPVRCDRGGGGGMNTTPTSWRTDEPCPCCGNCLTATDDGQPQITLDCLLCGWSSTWTGDHGTEVSQ